MNELSRQLFVCRDVYFSFVISEYQYDDVTRWR